MGNFRIFIDAATLKANCISRVIDWPKLFPHLYRCGHIEGPGPPRGETRHRLISASL